jgi:hypothetical protein
MKLVIFDVEVQGYKPGSLGLILDEKKPIVGLIAESMQEEVGYFIDTMMHEKHCRLLIDFNLDQAVLLTYYKLIMYKKLKISFEELLDLAPLDESKFPIKSIVQKVEKYKKAWDLGIL